eukprot:TRINITY_DN3769_c0_g4_i3.p1 TRINITY_DN3769_c0_g4~~TRINITY_DN3769_c0_g4_i3.p1  ORF type:complete len:426 (+),score=72.04 TRINITY_DN3769_c0_g4_i3:52-1329(+)
MGTLFNTFLHFTYYVVFSRHKDHLDHTLLMEAIHFKGDLELVTELLKMESMNDRVYAADSDTENCFYGPEDHTALFYAIQGHLEDNEGHIHRRWLKIIEMLLKDAPLEIVISNRVPDFHQCDCLVRGDRQTFPRSYEIFQLITDKFSTIPLKQFFTSRWHSPGDIQGLMLDNQYKGERNVFSEFYNPEKHGSFVTDYTLVNRYFPRFINFLIGMMDYCDFDEMKQYINDLPKPLWEYTKYGMFDELISIAISKDKGDLLEFIFKDAPLNIRTRKPPNDDDTYLHKAAKRWKPKAICALSKGPLIVRTVLNFNNMGYDFSKRRTPVEAFLNIGTRTPVIKSAHFFAFRSLVTGFSLEKVYKILSENQGGKYFEEHSKRGQKTYAVNWCIKRSIKIAWIQDQLDEPIYNHEGAAKNAALWMYTSSWI